MDGLSLHIVVIGADTETRQSLGGAGEELQCVFLDDANANLPGQAPDAFLWSLPATSADLALMEQLKKRWSSSPVIVLGDFPNCKANVLTALETGASDFIMKPLNPRELGLRIQVQKAKAEGSAVATMVCFGDITIDMTTNTLMGPVSTQSISATETLLLAVLADSTAEHPVHKKDLKQRCWRGHAVTDNALHRKLHAVRQLLRETSDTVVIQTKYNVGFYLRSCHVSMKIAS